MVITLFRGGSAITFPGGLHQRPNTWSYDGRDAWSLDVVGPSTPLRLFDPASDAEHLTFSRIGDAGRQGLFRVKWSEVTGRPVFHLALPVDSAGSGPPDYTASLVIENRVSLAGKRSERRLPYTSGSADSAVVRSSISL